MDNLYFNSLILYQIFYYEHNNNTHIYTSPAYQGCLYAKYRFIIQNFTTCKSFNYAQVRHALSPLQSKCEIMNNKKNIPYLVRTFGFAFKGLAHFYKHEQKALIHSVIAIFVVISGIFMKISTTEWFAVTFAITLVISLEIVNTAIEKIVDLVSPNHHKLAGQAKDLAAGAVLCSAIGAATIGCIVFIPKLITIFK